MSEGHHVRFEMLATIDGLRCYTGREAIASKSERPTQSRSPEAHQVVAAG